MPIRDISSFGTRNYTTVNKIITTAGGYWRRRENYTGSKTNIVTKIHRDVVYTLRRNYVTTTPQYFYTTLVARSAGLGNILWETEINVATPPPSLPALYGATPVDFHVDLYGKIFVCIAMSSTSSVIVELDSSGSLVAQTFIAYNAGGFKMDNHGNFYIKNGATESIMKFDQSGILLWENQPDAAPLNTRVVTYDMIVPADQSAVYVGGSTFVSGINDEKIVLQKLDASTGALVWKREFGATFGGSGLNRITKLAYDPTFRHVVAMGDTGDSSPDPLNSYSLFLYIVDFSGNVIRQEKIDDISPPGSTTHLREMLSTTITPQRKLVFSSYYLNTTSTVNVDTIMQYDLSSGVIQAEFTPNYSVNTDIQLASNDIGEVYADHVSANNGVLTTQLDCIKIKKDLVSFAASSINMTYNASPTTSFVSWNPPASDLSRMALQTVSQVTPTLPTTLTITSVTPPTETTTAYF